MAFVVKVDKTGSPGAALVQQKGRDQWLEKIEERTVEEVTWERLRENGGF